MSNWPYCGKVSYPSQRSALAELERLQAQRQRPDTRIVYCWRCAAYHVTSQSRVPPEEWRPT